MWRKRIKHGIALKKAGGTLNAGRVSKPVLNAFMRHRSFATTDRYYLNKEKLVEGVTDGLFVPSRSGEALMRRGSLMSGKLTAACRRKSLSGKWPKRGSNPHSRYRERDFKSRASANSAIRPNA